MTGDLFGPVPTPRRQRSAEITPELFFKRALPHSIIKADIVSKYAVTWAKIIVNHRLNYRQDPHVYVVDLFCGCGKYEECGTWSTPMRLVEQMIASPKLLENVSIRFNDESSPMIERLRTNIQSIPGYHAFAHEIEYSCLKAESTQIMSWLTENAAKASPTPMLVFIDPFGYKEISRDLLKLVINTPQSDVIMFFNYRRINRGMTVGPFQSNMNKIFSESRVEKIKKQLATANSAEREMIIIHHLRESLTEIGAKYIVPYVVVPEDEEHSSHYIIGITKHERGFEELKKRLRIDSRISENATATFGFNLSSLERDKLPQQHSVFGTDTPKPSRIEVLANQLHESFRGQVRLFSAIHDAHQKTTEHTEPEYRQAIRLLLASGRATSPDIDQDYIRKNPKAEIPIGDTYKIRFV